MGQGLISLCFALVLVPVISFAGESGHELKDALKYLTDNNITRDAPIVSEEVLQKIKVVKDEIGSSLLDAKESIDFSKDEAIDKKIKSIILDSSNDYKVSGKKKLESETKRKNKNNDVLGLFDSISWDEERFGEKNEFLFVVIRCEVGCGEDSFIYGFFKTSKKWVKFYESDDPYYQRIEDVRNDLKIVMFDTESGECFLLVNNTADCQSNGQKITFSVERFDRALLKMQSLLGPVDQVAVNLDPEDPYSITLTKDGPVLRFVSELNADGKYPEAEIHFNVGSGDVVESYSIK